jgi:hypothetical protein
MRPHDDASEAVIDDASMPSPPFRCLVDGALATGVYRPRHDDVLVQIDGEDRIEIWRPDQVRGLLGLPLHFNTTCDRAGCSNAKHAGTSTRWCAACNQLPTCKACGAPIVDCDAGRGGYPCSEDRIHVVPTTAER